MALHLDSTENPKGLMNKTSFFKTILPWVVVCALVEFAIVVAATLTNHIMWTSLCFITTMGLMLYFTRRLKKRTQGTLKFGSILAKVLVAVVLVGVVSTFDWYLTRHYGFPDRFEKFQAEQIAQSSERLRAMGMTQEQLDLQISKLQKTNSSIIAQTVYPIISYSMLGLIAGLIAGAAFRREE